MNYGVFEVWHRVVLRVVTKFHSVLPLSWGHTYNEEGASSFLRRDCLFTTVRCVSCQSVVNWILTAVRTSSVMKMWRYTEESAILSLYSTATGTIPCITLQNIPQVQFLASPCRIAHRHTIGDIKEWCRRQRQ
jgi:hypothetical protein